MTFTKYLSIKKIKINLRFKSAGQNLVIYLEQRHW